MRNLVLALFALFALAAGTSSASANYCRGPHGWGSYPPQYCHGSYGGHGGYYREEHWGGRGYVTRYGVRTVTVRQRHVVVGGAPSPQWAYSRVQHHTVNACVACVAGYEQDPGTCECTRTTWHPGSPPQ